MKALFGGVFRGRRVFVTGHTGFKGSWLCEWLLSLGADVTGYSLPAPTSPALFEELGLISRLDHRDGDVRDHQALVAALGETQPDFVFHLAAQALVRASYQDPIGTYATNVLGTANVLNALRVLQKPCAAVFVTTDKCYENREWVYGYREVDALGGHDPYSSSKAAAEIAVASFRRSFFGDHPVRIASARAGNVIGGGDWAMDRIIPDCIRSLLAGQQIQVRNPHATRPWQHVLEPLSGYLWLAACLSSDLRPRTADLATAFNFGPDPDSNRSVRQLVEEILRHWPGAWQDVSDPAAVHEAGLLLLATDKARAMLGWHPVWTFAEAIEQTVTWYRQASADPKAARDLTRRQIADYESAAAAAGLPWASHRL